ncbi:PAS domain S-box protein [Hymenobacter caeli]|uniref:histidine kinase n=1 Tax=Hymenobacter caeli TaxID=2735894 RepID=A0ABX2FLP7_9BACT|nr:PAS domain S-box protein [Hymenobacter caeli]NRT18057.1 PAS domain S-box-containing protein [Hymenobacter caeli]
MNRPDPYAALQDLRARAERRRLAASVPPAPADAQRLVQELQTHQIELEMQYEELLLAQAAAEASRAQYVDLYDFAPVGYCTLAPDGTLAQLNLYTAQLLGATRQELLGRRLALFVAPAGRAALAQFLAGLWAAPGVRRTCELALHRPAGAAPQFVQLEGAVAAAAADPTGPLACRLALADVTARRAAADALAASEARFRATFEQSHDGLVLLSGLCLVDANATALRLLGATEKKEVLGRHLAGFWPDDQPDGCPLREALHHCAHEARAHGWHRHEWRRYDAAGRPRWDELSFNPVLVAGEPLLHVALRDVTERKLGQQRLEENEARLNLALEASDTGVFAWDVASKQLVWDARAQAVFGRAFDPAPVPVPVQMLGERLHPDDAPRVWAAAKAAIAARVPLTIEYRVVWPDGSVHHVSAAGRAVANAQGQFTGFAGVLRDVTALYAAEEELRYKNRLLDHILQNLPVILTRFGPEGRYRSSAGAGLRRLGLADGELVGRVAAEVFPGEAESFRRLLAGRGDSHLAALGTPERPAYFLTYSFWDPIYREGVRFSLDVTESELLKQGAARQQQQRQQEVLAAILTTQEEERRRIAEALHNGVGQLLYATRLHLDGLPTSEPVRAGQGLVNEAIRATRTLSFELTPGILEDFGLAVALGELAKRVPAAQLAVDLNLHGLDAPLAPALATAVYRVVQELLNNVMKHSQAREVFVQVAREGPEVHLSVEDNGVGFDPESPAARSGLGLASIRTRVVSLSGTLSVQGRPGHGTGVFITLPVAS